MNFIRVLLISTLVSTSFAADVAPRGDAAQASAFRGNWTETFATMTPFGPITHTPTYVRLEGRFTMQGGTGISLSAGTNINGSILPAALILRTDSTRDEFIQALQRARIYSGNYNGAQQPAAPAQRVEVPNQKAAAKQAAVARKAAAKQEAAARKSTAKLEKAAKKAEAAVRKQNAAAAKKAAAVVKKQEAVARKMAAKQEKEARKSMAKLEKVAKKAEAQVKKQEALARKAAAKHLAAARRAVRA